MNRLTGFQFANNVAHGAFVELNEGVAGMLGHRPYSPDVRSLLIGRTLEGFRHGEWVGTGLPPERHPVFALQFSGRESRDERHEHRERPQACALNSGMGKTRTIAALHITLRSVSIVVIVLAADGVAACRPVIRNMAGRRGHRCAGRRADGSAAR